VKPWKFKRGSGVDRSIAEHATGTAVLEMLFVVMHAFLTPPYRVLFMEVE
jgi:hypothetical protein